MQKPNILIVEDDDALRGELVELFKALGSTAVGAEDGAAAVRASQHQTFDLVLCDYKLRHESGLDVIKALAELGNAPAAANCHLMTAHIDLTPSAQAEIAASTGGLLFKPIGGSVLRRLVAQASGAPRC